MAKSIAVQNPKRLLEIVERSVLGDQTMSVKLTPDEARRLAELLERASHLPAIDA